LVRPHFGWKRTMTHPHLGFEAFARSVVTVASFVHALHTIE
ncbi:MAG: hypothetical protein RL413_915, partial [Actinomycetota bacterium]